MAMSDYEKQMEAEIKKRVEVIESEDYDLGVPFSRRNWATVAVLFTVSLILIIVGGVLQ